MAKKTQRKKITRTSSIEKTIAEGKQYLEATKKKRILKTRTMVQTIKDATTNQKKVTKKKVQKKRPTRPARKSLPAKPAKPARKVAQKKAKVSSLPIKTSSKKSMSSVKASIVPVRSDSRISNKSIGKATKFVKKSDNLPLPAYGFIDLCFCIDATGSMSSQLAQAQSTIEAIMEKIQNKVAAEGITLRFAVVTYRDHPPQDSTYVTQILDFTDHHEAITYVKKLNAWGGGDEPQAVHDGLLDCCQKLNWVNLPGTPVLRYIFHIADAPPHGKQFDTFESKQGCLCGKQTDDIIRAINRKQIHYRLIKVRNNPKVDKMASIFKKGIVDFDQVDIGHAREMDVRVSDMIIHEILPDFA